MKKNIFRSRLFLCAPAAFCLCATLLCACSAQGNAVPASVHEQALAQLKAQDAELQALTEQVAELKAALADAQRAAVLEDTRTEREKRLAADLYAHPELIPIEGTPVDMLNPPEGCFPPQAICRWYTPMPRTATPR